MQYAHSNQFDENGYMRRQSVCGGTHRRLVKRHVQ